MATVNRTRRQRDSAASTPTSELPSFIRSVDQIEAATGLDFLRELSDEVEQVVEASAADPMW